MSVAAAPSTTLLLTALALLGAAVTAEARRPATYGALPLTFEANQGQTDPAVGFVVFLTPTEVAPR